MKNYYAHSGLSKNEIPAQPYQNHVRNMLRLSGKSISILPECLQESVRIAILFHDIGKLHYQCQKILGQDNQSEEKMLNHVEAGMSYCIKQYRKTENEVWIYALYLIHGHHIGFANFDEVVRKTFDPETFKTLFLINEEKIRDKRNYKGGRFCDYMDRNILNFVRISKKLMPEIEWTAKKGLKFDICNADLRMALSIFSDADHLDTSIHYGLYEKRNFQPNFFSFKEKCNKYYEELKLTALSNGIPKKSVESRSLLFDLTNGVDISKNTFFRCSAPTGKGKTLALFNLACRIAAQKNKKRIFNIIPFTNIIAQTAAEYEKIIGKSFINEIHSRVEYSSGYTRKYSQLWNKPINISTAVQFFESLFSNRPSRLRKVKEFSDSVIIFDEYHAAMDHHLWIPSIEVMKSLSEKYNIDFIFGSGSSADYWEIGMDDSVVDVLEVVPEEIYRGFVEEEKNRISFKSLGQFDEDLSLLGAIKSKVVKNKSLTKSSILIANTIANAVCLTRAIKSWGIENKIYHLTSFLTPEHKSRVLKEVKEDLKRGEKIFLISTSIVECGVDFSFEIGFREKASLMSAIQTGGRVNRNGEMDCAEVWEFSLNDTFLRDTSNAYTNNFNLNNSISARIGLDVELDNCAIAVENEILNFGNLIAGKNLTDSEKKINFKNMGEDFRVIISDAVEVITDEKIVDKLIGGDMIAPIKISEKSVSVSLKKLEKKFQNNYKEIPLSDGEKIYHWISTYDNNTYGIGIAL